MPAFFVTMLSVCVSVFQTVRFKNELERNITIKLGYANAKVNRFTLIIHLTSTMKRNNK